MVNIGLLCVLALGQGQKISIDIDALTAASALQRIGSSASLTLTTSPQTANDILLLRFKDVPIEEAMRRIAAADDASWKREGDSYRLIRTSDQVRAEEESQLKQDVDSITKTIAKKVAVLDKLPAWGPEAADQLASKVSAHLKTFNPQDRGGNWYQSSNQLSDQAPFGRAMTRVLATLDPKELAQLPPRIKTVWSTNPTASQLPMPQQVLPVINQFLKDNADWAAAAEKYHLKAPTFGNTTYWVGGFGDFSSTNATSGNVAVVLLSATAYGEPDSLQLTLAAYDSKGKKIAETQENLGNAYYEEMMNDPPAPAAGERTLTPSDIAKEILDVEGNGRSNRKPLPPDLVAKIIDVTHSDPLNIFVGSTLKEASDIRGVNLAAHLSDQMMFASFVASQKSLTVDRFLSMLSLMGGKSEIKDGWLMVQPSRPVDARTRQVDRKELAKYLQRCANPKHLSLDEQAAFALALPDEQDNPLPQTLSSLIRPGDQNQYYDHDMLKIYGLMTREQKSRMMGEGLPCGALNDQQKDCLNRMVYGMNTFLQYQPQRMGRDEHPNFDLYFNGIMHEPTESLPSGIPPRALIKLTEDDSSVVMTGDKVMAQYTQPGREFTASSLAWQKYSQDHPDLFPWASDENQKVDLGRLQYGKRTQLDFVFQFTPVLSFTQSLEDKDPSNFQAVTMADLPDEFKKQYQEQYDNYVKSYANFKPGQFGGPNRNANIPPVP